MDYCRLPKKGNSYWKKDNFFVQPLWMSLPNYLHDCYFYCYSKCLKVGICQYRHEISALGNERVCDRWLQGNCWVLHCPNRHMCIMTNRRSETPCYWELRPPHGCLKPHCPFKHTLTETNGGGRVSPRIALCQQLLDHNEPEPEPADQMPPVAKRSTAADEADVRTQVREPKVAKLVTVTAEVADNDTEVQEEEMMKATPTSPSNEVVSSSSSSNSSCYSDADAGIEADAQFLSEQSIKAQVSSSSGVGPKHASTPARPDTNDVPTANDSGRHGSSYSNNEDEDAVDDDDDDDDDHSSDRTETNSDCEDDHFNYEEEEEEEEEYEEDPSSSLVVEVSTANSQRSERFDASGEANSEYSTNSEEGADTASDSEDDADDACTGMP